MSKSERQGSGQSKKEYNQATGQGKHSNPIKSPGVIHEGTPFDFGSGVGKPGVMPDFAQDDTPVYAGGTPGFYSPGGPGTYQPTPPKKGNGASVNDLIKDFESGSNIYGGRIGQKPGTMNTGEFRDSDGDGTDDRNQRKAGGKNIVARRQDKSLYDRKAEKAEKGTTRTPDDRKKRKAVQLRETYKGAIKQKLKNRKNKNK